MFCFHSEAKYPNFPANSHIPANARYSLAFQCSFGTQLNISGEGRGAEEQNPPQSLGCNSQSCQEDFLFPFICVSCEYCASWVSFWFSHQQHPFRMLDSHGLVVAAPRKPAFFLHASDQYLAWKYLQSAPARSSSPLESSLGREIYSGLSYIGQLDHGGPIFLAGCYFKDSSYNQSGSSSFLLLPCLSFIVMGIGKKTNNNHHLVMAVSMET